VTIESSTVIRSAAAVVPRLAAARLECTRPQDLAIVAKAKEIFIIVITSLRN
jgi:hypothetical protein